MNWFSKETTDDDAGYIKNRMLISLCICLLSLRENLKTLKKYQENNEIFFSIYEKVTQELEYHDPDIRLSSVKTDKTKLNTEYWRLLYTNKNIVFRMLSSSKACVDRFYKYLRIEVMPKTFRNPKFAYVFCVEQMEIIGIINN
ncbi:hypothetical protein RF11_09177 [Thelohanellus kitauei]|uniref:Uncharacterized protein n=1 Tax=Thelohanellus kitauei TaxID=669202 RepID=A0A0C2NB71_THEKT|nr:hypothetical protein RF11_09177 [Thelohanellus kitauei]